MSKIVFPEGITWEIKYYIAGDSCIDSPLPNDLSYMYTYAEGDYSSSYLLIRLDTSNVTSMSNMFYNSKIYNIIFDKFDTSNVTNMSNMFDGSWFKSIDLSKFDTSNVTNMSNMFDGSSFKSIDLSKFNTSNVTNMYRMFYQADIEYIDFSNLDLSKVSNVENMFYYCSDLKEISDMNLSSLLNFCSTASRSWIHRADNIEKIGVIDCDSVTDMSYVFGNTDKTKLTDLGGFRNLGKSASLSGTSGNYFLMCASNLTHQSIMNVLNLLYDRAANGLSNLTLKLHANHMALLSDEDKLVAVNKGWTLTT